MRLYLIRHGESVDNVAGLYAGSRDSSLTSHGALQAGRLASSLAQSCSLTHIFSSPLQRAAKTAEAVGQAQLEAHGAAAPAVTLVSELREKHFGSLEGVSFRRPKPPCHDAETSLSIRARAESFWDQHLLPLLRGEAESETDRTCAVVAHGILLQALASLLVKLSTNTLWPSGFESSSARADGLPSWSNTGFLEAYVSPVPFAVPNRASPQPDGCLPPWQLRIQRVNCVSHLDKLKKTRGGIGSAPFDGSQRTLSHFFSAESKPSTRGK